MRIPRILTLASCLGLGVTLVVTPAMAQSPRATEAPVALPEIPNGVAVADTGVALVSFHDLKQVGVVASDGTLSTLDIGCSPSAVEIAPAGDTGWAVCQDSTHVTAVDIATRTVTSADEGLDNPVALDYSPATKQVVIGGYTGQITVVSVTGPQDYFKVRTFNIGGVLPALALSSDGLMGFAPNLVGAITRFDVSKGTSVKLTLANPRTYITSVSLSTGGSLLYAGAGEEASGSSDVTPVLLGLDPSNGKTLQRIALSTAMPAFGSIIVATAHRTLYVGSGIGLGTGASTAGVLAVALDAAGRMGATQAVFDPADNANALALSGDGRRLVVGSVQSALLRSSEDNTPYPPSIGITGSLAGTTLAIAGRSNGLAPGAKVTIQVKDLGRKGSSFVAQRTRATVTSLGTFAWKGPVKAAKVAVYVQSGSITSRVITVTSR